MFVIESYLVLLLAENCDHRWVYCCFFAFCVHVILFVMLIITYWNDILNYYELFCTSCSWTNGINDWEHISEKIKLHEKSLSHIKACLTADRWERNNTLSEDLKSQINIEVGFWRQVIKLIYI